MNASAHRVYTNIICIIFLIFCLERHKIVAFSPLHASYLVLAAIFVVLYQLGAILKGPVTPNDFFGI